MTPRKHLIVDRAGTLTDETAMAAYLAGITRAIKAAPRRVSSLDAAVAAQRRALA